MTGRNAVLLLGALALAAAAGARGGEEPAAPKWVKVDVGTKTDLLAVHFPTPEKGWAVGRDGLVLASADGGKTWAKQDSGLAKSDLYSVFFLDAERGWACGDVGDGPKVGGHMVMNRPLTGAAVIRTTDGGKTWKPSWAPTNFVLTDIWMLSADRGVMVSHGGPEHKDGDTLVGSEGGGKWASTRAFRALHAVTFLNEKTGFAVGTPVMVGFMPTPKDPLYVEKGCRLVRTDDGGRTWAPVKHPELGANELVGISFAGGKAGWAAGMGETILATTDGGETWARQESGVTSHLRDVFALDAEHAWAVGHEGTIIATADAGKTWQRAESGTGEHLRRVCFPSPACAVSVGLGGTILRLERPAAGP